jgi:hypothetical protein
MTTLKMNGPVAPILSRLFASYCGTIYERLGLCWYCTGTISLCTDELFVITDNGGCVLFNNNARKGGTNWLQ